MSLFNGGISTISFEDDIPRLDLLNHYDHLASTYEESVFN